MSERLTDAEIDEVARVHAADPLGRCNWCGDEWPCFMAAALADLRDARAELEGLRGVVMILESDPLLRELHDRSRISQSRLAEAAGFDHSYVSRLESGSRELTREAVLKLANAMKLPEAERDGLLASAGFMPGKIESLLAGEPVLSEALGFLQNRAVPAEVRDDVRNTIALLVREAQRAALSTGRYQVLP